MYEQISANVRNSLLLILVFIIVVGALGYVFGRLSGFGYAGVVLALVIALAMSFSSYYYSDRLVLAMSGARIAERERFPLLYNSVEGLSIASGLPTPKTYIIDDTAPNAFATGRDPQHSAIAVTTGLLEKMDRLELEGVIAHEMSHIKNYDIRLATLTVVLVGVVVLLSDWMLRSFWWGRGRREQGGNIGPIMLGIGLIFALVAPVIAQVMRLAVSRQREYLADAGGAMLTRYPPALASALRKLGEDKEPLEVANKATAHLWIVNPLKEHGGWVNGLFETHPPIEERVRRLEAMGA